MILYFLVSFVLPLFSGSGFRHSACFTYSIPFLLPNSVCAQPWEVLEGMASFVYGFFLSFWV